jgi:phytoene desaturase
MIFNKFHDEQMQLAEIERLFPGEGENYLRFMRDLKDIYEQTKPLFLDRVFLKKRALFSWRNLLGLWRGKAHLSVAKIAAKYFRDPRLQHAFSLQSLYIGGSPAATPGLYSMIPYAEQAFGVWYMRGGFATLAELLEKELQERGADIFYSATVSDLSFEGRRCKGLSVGAKQYEHDIVVYNGDFPLLAKLMNTDASTSKIAIKRNKYKPSSGCVLVYMLANKRWNSLSGHQYYLPHDFDRQLDLIFNKGELPTHPAYYVFCPQAIDEQVAPSGKTLLYMLIPVATEGQVDWSKAAPRLVDLVLRDLEARALNGLRRSIEWKELRSPQDARQAGLFEGGSFGIAPTWLQSGMFRPQIVPEDVEGLYAVGASIHPGGGVPIVMQGAKLLAQHLVKEMKL